MAWLVLLLAGLFEIGWAVGLKWTDGFTRPWSAGSSLTRAKSLYAHADGSVSPAACIASHEL